MLYKTLGTFVWINKKVFQTQTNYGNDKLVDNIIVVEICTFFTDEKKIV